MSSGSWQWVLAFVPHDAPVRPASGPKQSMGPVTAPPPVGPGGMRAGPIGTVVGPPTLSPMAPQPMSTGTGYTMMGAAMPGSSTKNDIHCTDEPMKPPPGPMTPPEGVKHNVAGPVAPEPASAESLSSSGNPPSMFPGLLGHPKLGSVSPPLALNPPVIAPTCGTPPSTVISEGKGKGKKEPEHEMVFCSESDSEREPQGATRGVKRPAPATSPAPKLMPVAPRPKVKGQKPEVSTHWSKKESWSQDWNSGRWSPEEWSSWTGWS